MGVEYFLSDMGNRRVYWLGKGAWHDAFGNGMPANLRELRAALTRPWETLPGDTEFLDRTACDIWGFVKAGEGHIHLCSDASEDEEFLPEVGGIYDDENRQPDPLADIAARFRSEAASELGLDPSIIRPHRRTRDPPAA